MNLSFDGEPTVDRRHCGQCGVEHDSAVGFVLRDGDAYAVYWAAWYPHEREAWVDMTIGSWQEPNYPDNVTFGCRIGQLGGEGGPQCTLVRGGQVRSDNPLLGQKLDRDDALAHPWLDSFWEVVDWLILNDPTLREHIYEWR